MVSPLPAPPLTSPLNRLESVRFRFSLDTLKVMEVTGSAQALASWTVETPKTLVSQPLPAILDETSGDQLFDALHRLEYASPVSLLALKFRRDSAKAPSTHAHVQFSRKGGAWLDIATPLPWRVTRFKQRLLDGHECWDDRSIARLLSRALGAEAIVLADRHGPVLHGKSSFDVVRDHLRAIGNGAFDSPQLLQDLENDLHLLMAPLSERHEAFLLGYSRKPWSEQAMAIAFDANMALKQVQARRQRG